MLGKIVLRMGLLYITSVQNCIAYGILYITSVQNCIVYGTTVHYFSTKPSLRKVIRMLLLQITVPSYENITYKLTLGTHISFKVRNNCT